MNDRLLFHKDVLSDEVALERTANAARTLNGSILVRRQNDRFGEIKNEVRMLSRLEVTVTST